MDTFYSSTSDERHSQPLGADLDYFVTHPNSVDAGLLREHVVALRLYTTAAYPSINNPLRAGEKHPFPMTVAYLTDGIKRLRAVAGDRADAHTERDFWRGMKNTDLPDAFKEEGGTEYAPMSTSSDIEIALLYSAKSEKRLLTKVKTASFMECGAAIQYLSAFPDEVEYLYPPLTYLQPTGLEESLTVNGIQYTVIEVTPKL